MLQVWQPPDVIERELYLRAADNALASENEKGGWRCLDETLQPVPTRLRDFAKLIGGIQDKIENDQGKIAIAQKQIGGFDCVERFGATNPKQVTQLPITQWLRIE